MDRTILTDGIDIMEQISANYNNIITHESAMSEFSPQKQDINLIDDHQDDSKSFLLFSILFLNQISK